MCLMRSFQGSIEWSKYHFGTWSLMDGVDLRDLYTRALCFECPQSFTRNSFLHCAQYAYKSNPFHVINSSLVVPTSNTHDIRVPQCPSWRDHQITHFPDLSLSHNLRNILITILTKLLVIRTWTLAFPEVLCEDTASQVGRVSVHSASNVGGTMCGIEGFSDTIHKCLHHLVSTLDGFKLSPCRTEWSEVKDGIVSE